jgi:rfaE bifunctional protein kinase chain/domain
MTDAAILAEFPRLRALVVGDVCLDRWCSYDPALADVSRETGLKRTAVVSTEVTPGAAGTIANNLAALGAGTVDVLGMAGDDGFGYELERVLEARGISHHLLLRVPGIPTFTYTKLINAVTGVEDLPRVDFVFAKAIPDAIDREIAGRLDHIAADYDVILVSDQAETSHGGVVTPRVREVLERIGSAHPEIVIWVDSRLRAEHFRKVIVKPNRDEAGGASRRALGRVDYAELRRHMQARLLVITHGSEGALIVDETRSTWAPARRIEKLVDICGAGDSFSAAASLAFKVTGDPLTAARFGNMAASITIMIKGTGTASADEILKL